MAIFVIGSLWLPTLHYQHFEHHAAGHTCEPAEEVHACHVHVETFVSEIDCEHESHIDQLHEVCELCNQLLTVAPKIQIASGNGIDLITVRSLEYLVETHYISSDVSTPHLRGPPSYIV